MLRDRPQMRNSSSSRLRRRDGAARVGYMVDDGGCFALLPKPANPGFSALPGYCTNSCVHSPPAIKRRYRPR